LIQEKGNSTLKTGGGCLTDPLMSNTLTIRLPEDLSRWLDEEARATGLPKGKIVKDQLERLRNAKVRQPFLDLAGCVDGVPELSAKKGFTK
jgi:hypothetical protein